MLASDKVSFKYRKNKRQILSDLSITVNDGEFVAVMGESGSGKSTFLAVMAGILTPDSGRVLFNDTDIYSLKDEEITAQVTVTNTGRCAGKEVVQLYFSAPYTPGGAEKSAVELGGFAKTVKGGDGQIEQCTLEVKFK